MKPELSFMLLISLVVFEAITVTNATGGGRFGGGGGLRMNFYRFARCPQAERIVRGITWSKVRNDPTLAAKLLRVHYHDCFVRVRPLYTSMHAMRAYPPTHLYILFLILLVEESREIKHLISCIMQQSFNHYTTRSMFQTPMFSYRMKI